MADGADPLRAALPALRCPHCGAPLALAEGVARCAAGHAFDVARQGYLSLLGGGRAPAGDTAAMVAAREAFLGAGHYAPLEAAVAQAASTSAASGALVDLGAGTGSYAAAALQRMPDRVGIAFDTSRPALQRAARAHPRLAAVGADVWAPLPLGDDVAAVVLDVFAPRNGAEIARVLAPNGTLVVVVPTAGHLRELVAPLGLLRVDERKEQRLAAQLEDVLRPLDQVALEWTMELDGVAVSSLVAMGPSAFHPDAARAERIAALGEPVAVTASVTISRYQPR